MAKREVKLAVRVRPARLEDRAALAELWMQGDELHAQIAPDFFRQSDGRSGRSREFFTRALHDKSHALLLAEASSKAVGLLYAQIYDTPASPVLVALRRCHVADLVVDVAWRRRGVGRRLMDAVAKWARAQGAAQLVLTVWHGNRGAQRFYRALGFGDVSHVMKRDL